jgi:hypothetical protein
MVLRGNKYDLKPERMITTSLKGMEGSLCTALSTKTARLAAENNQKGPCLSTSARLLNFALRPLQVSSSKKHSDCTLLPHLVFVFSLTSKGEKWRKF